jgi:hypothetical protein
MLKYAVVVLFAVMSACIANGQINTPLKVKDVANEPGEVKEVVIDFEKYLVRAISYPARANKNSITKTLYYKVKVNDDNTVSDLQLVNDSDVTEEIEDSALPLYFTAPSYGSKAKENSDYDDDFRNAVEKPAKKFKKYSSKSSAKSETIYLSFNFVVK